jgi:hypothetical protein
MIFPTENTTIVLLTFFPLTEPLANGLKQLNWASFALAFALVGLKVSFLLAYRAGWNIGTAAIVVNTDLLEGRASCKQVTREELHL